MGTSRLKRGQSCRSENGKVTIEGHFGVMVLASPFPNIDSPTLALEKHDWEFQMVLQIGESWNAVPGFCAAVHCSFQSIPTFTHPQAELSAVRCTDMAANPEPREGAVDAPPAKSVPHAGLKTD